VARGAFGLDETKIRVRRAVESVEARSAAEVVVAVRASAGSYVAADCIAGAVLAFAALLFTLYAPPVFALHWIASTVLVAFVAGGAVARAVPPLRLLLAGKAVDRALADTARALFFDLGVSATRDRTGILVLVAQLEQRCVVLADYGVRNAVPEDAWKAIADRIESALAREGVTAAGVDALVTAIERAGDELATYLPRRDGDVNELEDVAW
jgi:putative membrane protein